VFFDHDGHEAKEVDLSNLIVREIKTLLVDHGFNSLSG
jgi:hypothetical protein